MDGEQGEGAAPYGVRQLWDGCPCATCLVLGTGRDRGVLLGVEPGAEGPGVLLGVLSRGGGLWLCHPRGGCSLCRSCG